MSRTMPFRWIETCPKCGEAVDPKLYSAKKKSCYYCLTQSQYFRYGSGVSTSYVHDANALYNEPWYVMPWDK